MINLALKFILILVGFIGINLILRFNNKNITFENAFVRKCCRYKVDKNMSIKTIIECEYKKHGICGDYFKTLTANNIILKNILTNCSWKLGRARCSGTVLSGMLHNTTYV